MKNAADKKNNRRLRTTTAHRFISLFMAVMMMANLCPLGLAAAPSALNNTALTNQTILDSLKAVTGDGYTAQSAQAALQQLGLANQSGELAAAMIELNGQKLTLAEVWDLINSPGVNLDQVATVDSTPITLRDLKTMIEIEQEIQRIKKTYFSDVTLDEAHQKTLASLKEQIATRGIKIYDVKSEADNNTSVLIFPSGIDQTIYAGIDTTTEWRDFSAFGLDTRVVLKDKNGKQLDRVPNYDISIPWVFINGSAEKGTDYNGTDPEHYGSVYKSGTLKFAANSTKTELRVYYDLGRWTGDAAKAYDGDKTFLLQFYNPHNIVFKNGQRTVEKMIKANMDWNFNIIKEFFSGNFNLSLQTNNTATTSLTYSALPILSDSLVKNKIYNQIEVKLSGLSASNVTGTYDCEVLGKSVGSLAFNGKKTAECKAVISCDESFYSQVSNWQVNIPVKISNNAANVKWKGDVQFKLTMSFVDSQPPYVTGISVDSGGKSFTYGQTVPVTVYYSEYVDVSRATLDVNGETLSASEAATQGLSNGALKSATFLYRVKEADAVDLHVANPQGVTDMVGNSQKDGDFKDITFNNIIDPEYKWNTFKNPRADLVTGEDGKIVCHVSIDLNDNNEITDWLYNEAYANRNENYKVPSIYASTDGGKTRIDLYADDADNPTRLTGSFIPQTNSETAATGVVEFYLDPVLNSAANYQLMVGAYAAYTLAPVVFLKSGDLSIADNFPTDGVVSADQGGSLALTYAVSNPNATWKNAGDFSWSSSNESIATISADGHISLTGAPGEVVFTLTAKNGNIEGKAVSINSRPLTVKSSGSGPFLTIPDNMTVISIKKGDNAQIRWTSNFIDENARNSKDTVFSLEVLAADYTDGTIKKGPSVWRQSLTASKDNPVSGYLIPAQYLSGISAAGKYSYIVEVSSARPDKPDQMMTAACYIHIGARPATVKLVKLNRYFITDSTRQLPISWTLENVDTANGSEFIFEITNNQDNVSVYKQTATDSDGGSYTLAIPKVANGFKDIYTVTARVKNADDEAWSCDSFVLHVYSDSALKVWFDGADPGGSYTMSNYERIKQMSSEEILALKRDINLKNVVSINYGDHAWGQIRDQIKWNSSDSTVASLNYQQGGYFRNIEEIPYDSYRPDSKLALSGLKDGNARLTVTHAATGMQQTVDVQVQTLKDKLYLFQIYPQTQTTLTYTNGNGEKRSLQTNAGGELALFEDSGIKGEVYMESSIGDAIYMGTLYSGLLSSEKDSTRLELYPLNIIRLRESAAVDLYFKNPDGTPYSGEVTLRGGVYKNNRYCSQALINRKPGNEDQTMTLENNGHCKILMNTSQFWCDSNDEVLTPQDKLTFIYEVQFPNDRYYPQLISMNGNMSYEEIITFGESIVNLETVPEGQKNKPFVASQTTDYGLDNGRAADVRKFTGKIGPSDNHPRVVLDTTVLWWGEPKEEEHDHDLYFEDQYGTVFKNQTHQVLDHPFAKLPASRNTWQLDQDTVKDWPAPVQELHLVMVDGDDNNYSKKEMPFRAANMLGVTKAKDDSSLILTLGTLASSAEANANSMSLTDKVIGTGLDHISRQGTGNLGGVFKLVIAPTADPTVYVGLIATKLGSLSNEDPEMGSNLEYIPGFSDAMAMMKGKYLKEQEETYDKNKDKKGYSEHEFSFTFGGYMESEIFYNFEKKEWEVLVLNGGFNAGAGIDYKWNYNTFVGPVPVTAQLGLGASAEVIFKAAVQRGEAVQITYNKDAVNDYLTTLRIYAYFKAFAGVGFDYSCVALKIGLFGKVSLDVQFAWLNQPYANTKMNGQNFTVTGQIGIEADVKYLFFSEEYVLASKKWDIAGKSYNDWEKIQKTWEEIGKGSSGRQTLAAQALQEVMQDEAAVYPILNRNVIEGRDYLNQFDRDWIESPGHRLKSLDQDNGVKDLQTNSYPFANPVLTDDGQIIAYVSDGGSSDIEKTQVCWSMMKGGSYPEGSPINGESNSYGDSQLKLAGNKDFAAAVWVAQSESISKEEGEEGTNADIIQMSNSTEVMASVYDGSSWTTTRLSDNDTPDIAPVVAANDSQVLAAWRDVYAPDTDNPLEFSGADNILYRLYDRNTGTWSEPRTLYNGTNGRVKGLEAAMLDDGTAAVTYSFDTSGTGNLLTYNGEGVDSQMEIVYAVIDPQGNIIKNVQLTNDDYLDENPKLTRAVFDDNVERFVLGWYSIHNADGTCTNDIRLCAFDKNGAIHDNFVDSISSVNTNASVNISSNFQFVKNVDRIENLSILWEEPAPTGTVEEDKVQADKDLLKAVRFGNENGRIYITSALDVAEMDDYSLIDYYDAYDAGNDTIKGVILGTHYDNGYKENVVQVEEDGQMVDRTIYTPIPRSDLHTVTAAYENKIEVNAVAVDYETIIPGSNIAVQFTILNRGVQPVNNITIQIGDNIRQFDSLLLLPNENITLTVFYDIPADEVLDPVYTVTANFPNTDPALAHQFTCTGQLRLKVPDIGISGTDIVKQENGSRVIQVSLYNNSGVVLEGSGRTVKIGLYTDPACTHLAEAVEGQEDGQPFTMDPADLGLTDAGAYTKQFTFNISGHIPAGSEIPDGGVHLYAKAWVEEMLLTGDKEEGQEITEYSNKNNTSPIVFDSPLDHDDDHPVTISSELSSENGVSTVRVNLQNNSFKKITNGSLTVSLLDKQGNILAVKRSYNSALPGEGLINLDGEESTQLVFNFDTQGASMVVTYAPIVKGDNSNARLSFLFMRGIPLKLAGGQTEYSFDMKGLSSTFISAAAEDPSAVISINGMPADSGSMVYNLHHGLNQFRIVVTAADGLTKQIYTVKIYNNQNVKA